MSYTPRTNLSMDAATGDLVRGVCNADPRWTIKSFIEAAVLEKIKRDRLTPRSSKTVRRGRPPTKKKDVPARSR